MPYGEGSVNRGGGCGIGVVADVSGGIGASNSGVGGGGCGGQGSSHAADMPVGGKTVVKHPGRWENMC